MCVCEWEWRVVDEQWQVWHWKTWRFGYYMHLKVQQLHREKDFYFLTPFFFIIKTHTYTHMYVYIFTHLYVLLCTTHPTNFNLFYIFHLFLKITSNFQQLTLIRRQILTSETSNIKYLWSKFVIIYFCSTTIVYCVCVWYDWMRGIYVCNVPWRWMVQSSFSIPLFNARSRLRLVSKERSSNSPNTKSIIIYLSWGLHHKICVHIFSSNIFTNIRFSLKCSL